jgi:hypothetical protein
MSHYGFSFICNVWMLYKREREREREKQTNKQTLEMGEGCDPRGGNERKK